ncbi:hypothetical protein AABB24_000589 [Solanum stoloniferum]|uniref:Uncharacterized protein n=1 Tax=Solanum stoloniferum TaxID=62892 RepID=A0ABD2VJA5_9SOLN
MFFLRTTTLCPVWLLQLCVSKNVVLYLTSFWYLLGCQFLWIITFYSTQLPGPNYHCREGSKLATLPPPDNILQSLLIVPRGVLYGCGDLYQIGGGGGGSDSYIYYELILS